MITVSMFCPTVIRSDNRKPAAFSYFLCKPFLDRWTDTDVVMVGYVTQEIYSAAFNREHLVVSINFQVKVFGEIRSDLGQELV